MASNSLRRQAGGGLNVKPYSWEAVMAERKARQFTDEELRAIHEDNRRRYFENRKLWHYMRKEDGTQGGM